MLKYTYNDKNVAIHPIQALLFTVYLPGSDPISLTVEQEPGKRFYYFREFGLIKNNCAPVPEKLCKTIFLLVEVLPFRHEKKITVLCPKVPRFLGMEEKIFCI